MFKIEDIVNKIHCADCLEFIRNIPDKSIDAIVTDPPAGISFMGQEWDTFDKSMFGKKGEEGENDLKVKKNFEVLPRYGNADLLGFQDFICAVFTEAIRVLKPGGHTLVWAIPRTSHHTAMGLERAGFDIRDCVYHIFGSGFPKSHNVALGIDKKTGYKKNRGHAIASGSKYHPTTGLARASGELLPDYKGHTPEAKQWEGWGTALKPAVECWWLCRKPLSEKTVAENVLKWGTGGLNIDGCRVEYTDDNKPIPQLAQGKTEIKTDKGMYGGNSYNESKTKSVIGGSLQGRFPANLIHDGSDEVMAGFPNTGGGHWSYKQKKGQGVLKLGLNNLSDKGTDKEIASAARFFYCAKASRSERDAGLEGVEAKRIEGRDEGQDERNVPYKSRTTPQRNQHPTVKPLALMRYLIKLITPPNGIVLDMFAGSGSTLVACRDLGIRFIGIEIEPKYVSIANKRLSQEVLPL